MEATNKLNPENKLFLNANDVAKMMNISKSSAYKIIKSLNEQLRKDGFITLPGKINRIYLNQHIYGLNNKKGA